MAELKGILKIVGKVGDLSFYKMGGVIVVRQGWGPDRKRMRNDPSFERARDHGKEFGACSQAGQLLRRALRPFLKKTADTGVTSRVTKLMFGLKKLDSVSPRGARNVATGIFSASAGALLNGYNFNKDTSLSNIFKKKIETDLKTGSFVVRNFLCKRDLAFPKGATHACLKGGLARMDFERKQYDVKETDIVTVSKKDAAQELVLKITDQVSGSGIDLMVFSVEFFQEVNGELYALKSARFNASALVEAGFKTEETGAKAQDERFKTRGRVQGAGAKMQDVRVRIQDERFKIKDSEAGVQDVGKFRFGYFIDTYWRDAGLKRT